MSTTPQKLVRGISLGTAINLNVLNMVGIGPFITLPLMVAALGSRALLGWIAGAALALADGMVWAELSTRFPQSGGSYLYLHRLYGPRCGRLLSFLFIWQLLFSAPLSTASGAVGLADYAAYIWPWLNGGRLAHVSLRALAAMSACLLATALIATGIRTVGRISRVLSVGVVLAILWIIVAALTHLHPAAAIASPARPSGGFGAGLLIAIYNYGGYYNICFLAGEVENPRRTLPRAIVGSILIVATLYVLLQICVLRIVPAAELLGTARTSAMAVFMARLWGPAAGRLMALLIVWTAFASVFSVLLGYSRVPWAAAEEGNFLRAFTALHPTRRYPTVALFTLGALSAVFCLFRLADLIAALVVIRIVFQFLLQAVGLLLYRHRLTGEPDAFRMPLYPLPALAAIAGFLLALLDRAHLGRDLVLAGLLLTTGLALYLLRARHQQRRPFRRTPG